MRIVLHSDTRGPVFLQNQWYVVAAASEVQRIPFARTVCNEPVVVFRRADGSIAALEDRCPHRKAPLSLGEIVGNDIQCGYHGMRFAGDGACTRIPSDPERAIPPAFRARAYPVIERFGLIFVWIGEFAAADPVLLPDFKANTADNWTAVFGYHQVRCHYQLVIDNLLDSTRLDYVHKTTLSASASGTEAPLEVEVSGDVVRTRRVIWNSLPTAFHVAITGDPGNIDRYQLAEFRPPVHVVLTIGAEPAGKFPDMRSPNRLVINSCTPETESSTHYFWSVARPFAIGDEAVSKAIREMTYTAFDEDARMLSHQQRMIESDRSGRPLTSFTSDRAAAAVRRILARKLSVQMGQTVAAD